MGSSASKFSKTVVGNETHKSARNILEKIALETKGDINVKANKYEGKLKGNLKEANFYHRLFTSLGVKKYVPSNLCELDYVFNTNIQSAKSVDRNPCLFSRSERFSKEGEAECGSDKIRGNENNRNDGTACAPYRRRYMCDYNLEHINKGNVLTTHDLLGNVLVTAKYEGESIVKNHPHKGTSDVCTALARSFADIGDIVRGRDMFRSNEEDAVQKGLRSVFRKIHEGLGTPEKDYYKDDGSGNYLKLREHWWIANRDQVWKAITCKAPKGANYFRKGSDGTNVFTSEGKCGHDENNVITNLDYVPQFLRWFDEWAEDFCRIRNHKLEKVKKECRGEYDSGLKRYCSGDGYDCTKTDISRNIFYMDLNCPRCEEECRKYDEWIEKKVKEFNKQKNKYTKEIEKLKDNSKSNYDKNFYLTLTKKYGSINLFLDTLKEGSHCSYNTIEDKIDFNKANQTFTSSKFCGACPFYGVNCNWKTCTEVKENEYKKKNKVDSTHTTEQPTAIDVLVTHIRGNDIVDDLKDCKKYGLFKGIRKQQWKCQYKNPYDECNVSPFVKDIDVDDRISFKVLLERWLKDFLEGYNKSKRKIKVCTKNDDSCIKGCKDKCECVEKWLKKKVEEWRQITQYFNTHEHDKAHDIAYKVKSYFEQIVDYVKKYIDDFENLKTLEEYEDCNGDHCGRQNNKKKKDIVTILLNRLQNKITTCKTQHESKNQKSCKASPKIIFDEDEEDDEDEVEEETTKDSAATEVTVEDGKVPEAPPAATQSACEIVKGILNGKCATNYIEGCKQRDDKTNPYRQWQCNKSSNLVTEDGICMPPRRQKLCVINLKTFREKTSVELRNAFIKCAAIETHFLWKYYKEKNNVKNDKILESGYIPEDFKRMMYYTFGDYRDLCLDKNIGNDVSDVENNIKGVFSKDNKTVNGLTRETWWETNGPLIWHGMLCALEKCWGKDTIKNNSKYEYNNVKFSDKSTTLEEFAKRPQFLRWMTEWGDEFCRTRKEKVDKLVEDCKEYECNEENMDQKKKKCEEACKVYQDWLKTWKDQYNKQSQKFTTDKGKKEYEVDPDVASSENAHKYLSKKLKSICQNGSTTDKCDYNCMENASKQPQTSACSQEQQQQGNTSSTPNHFPEAFDCPPKEIGDKCNCPKLPEPKYCVDKTAYDIRKEREKKSDNSLKGDATVISLTDCTKVDTITFFNDNIGTTTINEKEMYKVFPRNNDSCDNKSSNRFNSEKQWLCNNINHKKKNICLPPRRRYMCLRKIERMITKDVDDKDKFFQVVMKAAKEEGIRILKNYKEQNKTDFSEICDDMKYSFADLGDIIRGKDLWNTDKNYKNIQDKIRYVFDYMHKKLNSDDQKRYKDLVNHYDLRSDWWDANRKEVWKAMTCAAPRNAYIYKTTENSETKIRSTDMYYYCGHKDDPPDNDYIPQKLRWMTEWSEYFCKELNRKLEQMKTNCDSCKLNDSNCRDSNDGNNCRKCQQNCQEYTKLVNQGKKQFILQDNQYKEIYKKISNNSDGKAYVGTHVVEFLKKVEKNNCSDLNSADKYLYKGSNCKNLTFTENDNEHRTRTYAFTEKPIEYKNKCTCEITNNPLDKCPTPQNRIICNNLKLINSYRKNYTFNLKDWNSNLVPKNSSDNFGVLVPPRRKHLCLNNITALFLGKEIKNKENLRNVLLNSAFNEAYFLWTVYNKDSTTAFEAIKYSFADYGDIIKGTDIMESSLSDKIGKIFTNTLDTNARSKWWNENKQQVWHAMLCGYRRANDRFVIDADTCKLPKEDEIPQFLRWLIEWAKQACKEYSIRKSAFKDFCHCSNSDELSELDLLKDNSCNYELTQYIGWNTMVKQYMDGFNIKFQKVKNASSNLSISENSAQEYIKSKIESNECDFNDMKNIYEKITNRNNKDFQEIFKILCPNKKIEKDKSEEIDDETSSKPREEDTSHVEPPPLPPPPSPPPVQPPPSDEPFDSTILQTTIPFGVALALGSIAFLFLKKKPKTPVDLIRVLDVHKGDYDIPTLKSSNRYIPYASDKYKGRTYIYMEGDSSGDEDKYAFMSDTTDVTSSESEYEELDINDIYVPGSPKYKTLIEVVLEPSKSNGNIPHSAGEPLNKCESNPLGDMVPTTNTFTDEEWNQLKHDFISQYVVREPLDVPKVGVSTDLPMNIVGNVLDDGINEKPFITSIHDRDLYTGEEISYNIHMSTNSMDDPKYVSNNVYSGIDLINDTLSGDYDIYDEVLKRKENELFGTNHMKNTSNNNVAKLTNSDPIMNQLDLLHKWLDRHKDMCNTWNTKEELLEKLNEQWNKDNDVGGDISTSNGNKKLNTDVSIQIDIDENKGKKEFSNMDTILDDMEDDIYYDVNDDENPFVDDIPMDHNKVDVPKKVHVEMKILNNTFNGSLEPEFPISDVWNI
ncbi:erythrocyte membrane protein 1 [Plasmodium falciparum RAJ116]|uniref:Erythrocyte membrane protein 1 n=1 Tax=Plasmodium falciparum RAJ116 TaxID=580058 RepID=A0A0L0CUK0_PLAFA|nr:erythrocyte membrane protein 1 [Plasmodium falciparum RAJ116]